MKKVMLLAGALPLVFASCQKEVLDKAPANAVELAQSAEELIYNASPDLYADVYENPEKAGETYVYAIPGIIKESCIENDHLSPMCCYSNPTPCYVVIEYHSGKQIALPNDGGLEIWDGKFIDEPVIDDGNLVSGTFVRNNG